jgi:uncharacterized lipoprotein YmbA
MNRAMPRRLLGGLGLVLAGCSSPEPDYHRLTMVPGVPRRMPPRAVEVRRVGLPGYLDRSEIMRAGPGTRLEALRNMRWGEGLGGMVGRVLAEDLAQRLPGCTVFNEAGSIALTADATIETEIQRFEAEQSGSVGLAAQVAIRSGSSRPNAARVFRVAAPVAGPGAAAVAAAMSAALGQLADGIAAALAPR